jgi:hypothetical protein
VLSKDPTVGFGLALEVPTVRGGSLRVVSLTGAFDQTYDLPRGGWRLTRRGYAYRGDDVRVTIQTGRRLKIIVRNGDFPLDGATPPVPIVVALRVGDRRLCLEFPEARLKAKGRRLIAKNAAPPETCDEPPEP